MDQTHESDEQSAARAAVLVLRAATSGASDVAHLRVGDGQPTSANQAAEQLAIVPKPIRCTAVLADDVLVVKCEPHNGGDATIREMVHGWLRSALAATAEGDASRVLLRGEQEEMVVSRATLLDLDRDYLLEVPYSSSGNYPSPEQSRGGIRWVVEIGPPAIITTDVNDLDLPEDLRAIIEMEFRRVVAEHADSADGAEQVSVQ